MNPRPLTVVVDLSVFIHQIENVRSSGDINGNHHKGYVKAQTAWLLSGNWLTSLVEDRQNYQILLVADQKDSNLKYWRHYYLAHHQIHYKAGRSLPEAKFKKTKRYVMDTVDQLNWRILRLTEYEADDLAASLVQVNYQLPEDKQNDILLVTVDTDWLAMVGDRVGWLCMYGYKPRYRPTIKEVNQWAIRRLSLKLKEPFSKASELWQYKAINGDKSDNLPKGSPLEVIDLFNPPEKYQIWKDPYFADHLRHYLDPDLWSELPRISPEQASKAEDYINRLGCGVIPRKVATQYIPGVPNES